MQPLSNIVHERSDRVVIEAVAPEIDGGRFPIKRVRGESVQVEADVLVDGHDVISAILLFRRAQDEQWRETPMTPLVNDRWRSAFRRRRDRALCLHAERVGRSFQILAPGSCARKPTPTRTRTWTC